MNCGHADGFCVRTWTVCFCWIGSILWCWSILQGCCRYSPHSHWNTGTNNTIKQY